MQGADRDPPRILDNDIVVGIITSMREWKKVRDEGRDDSSEVLARGLVSLCLGVTTKLPN